SRLSPPKPAPTIVTSTSISASGTGRSLPLTEFVFNEFIALGRFLENDYDPRTVGVDEGDRGESVEPSAAGCRRHRRRLRHRTRHRDGVRPGRCGRRGYRP